jgi:hypothetical protein
MVSIKGPQKLAPNGIVTLFLFFLGYLKYNFILIVFFLPYPTSRHLSDTPQAAFYLFEIGFLCLAF